MPKDYSMPDDMQETHHTIASLNVQELPPSMLGEILIVIGEYVATNDELVLVPPEGYDPSFRLAKKNATEESEPAI